MTTLAPEIDIENIEVESEAVYRYDMTHDDESCFRMRREFQEKWTDLLVAQAPWPTRHTPHSPLRVGYFSSDFRAWSGHWIFGPIILGHTTAIEPYTYSMTAPEWDDDDVTRQYQARTRFKDVSELSLRDAAGVIAADDLDILVDLMGFSFGTPQLIYALKPAPTIVTAWGHIAYGMQHRAVDYLFADPIACPSIARQHYSERVIDLPCAVAYQPTELPAITPETRRPFRFGCFHRFQKVSDRALRCWAEILHRCPDAELVIKSWDFARESDVPRLLTAFGSAARRIRIDSPTHWTEHLNDMNDIDVQLDTLPFTGGVVTMEALAMGVPTVTRTGRFVTSRCGTSIMTTVGLAGWCADTDEAYIERAVAAYHEPLESRASYRARLFDSPIGRIPDYIAAVEQRYQEIAHA